ncbi:hypothetical protein GN956_G10605 [Arapaima gigas]
MSTGACVSQCSKPPPHSPSLGLGDRALRPNRGSASGTRSSNKGQRPLSIVPWHLSWRDWEGCTSTTASAAYHPKRPRMRLWQPACGSSVPSWSSRGLGHCQFLSQESGGRRGVSNNEGCTNQYTANTGLYPETSSECLPILGTVLMESTDRK